MIADESIRRVVDVVSVGIEHHQIEDRHFDVDPRATGSDGAGQ